MFWERGKDSSFSQASKRTMVVGFIRLTKLDCEQGTDSALSISWRMYLKVCEKWENLAQCLGRNKTRAQLFLGQFPNLDAKLGDGLVGNFRAFAHGNDDTHF